VETKTSSPVRSGTVAIIGRPNVGKSTLLNAALGQAIAIVSPVPQTTRNRILGVVHRDGAELLLLDTPGIHRPHSRLGRALNRTARDATAEADVVLYITDVSGGGPARRSAKPQRAAQGADAPPERVHPGDRILLSDLGAGTPTILVVNKVDRVRDKRSLLPLLEELSHLREFAAVIPISAAKDDGVSRVLDEAARLLPERPARFDADALTDRPTRFFAAEFVREQILLSTQKEVPHAAAVAIERYETVRSVVHIEATIHVEREGQKGILVGHKGEMLKTIGTRARLRIEELTGQRVQLSLWVKVTPSWSDSGALLAELGYEGSS
jgi:GTP-binding protein Era